MALAAGVPKAGLATKLESKVYLPCAALSKKSGGKRETARIEDSTAPSASISPTQFECNTGGGSY